MELKIFINTLCKKKILKKKPKEINNHIFELSLKEFIKRKINNNYFCKECKDEIEGYCISTGKNLILVQLLI